MQMESAKIIYEKFHKIRDRESDIPNNTLWVTHISKTGGYNTVLSEGQVWKSAAWFVRKDFDDLADMSLSIFDDMITIIKRVKRMSIRTTSNR